MNRSDTPNEPTTPNPSQAEGEDDEPESDATQATTPNPSQAEGDDETIDESLRK